MVSTVLTGIAVVGVLFVIGYYIYEKYLNKSQGKSIRVLLFEHIGNDKLFMGDYPSEEREDDKLGTYIYIKRLKKAISLGKNVDFFPDSKFNKCLLICKYSNDDFRVMSRMRDNEWFKKINLQPEDYLEVEEVKDEEGEILEYQVKTDKKGQPIPLTDDNGQPLPDYSYETYDEPIGISQTAREAQRFNRSFTRRMEEKRGEKGGFWDKYGQAIMTMGVVIVMFMAMAYSTKQTNETQKYIADTFGEKADGIVKAMESPTFVQGLVDKIENKEREDNAPKS